MANKDETKTDKANAPKAAATTTRDTEITDLATPPARTPPRVSERDSELDRMFDAPADRAPKAAGAKLRFLRVSTTLGISGRRRGQEIDENGARTPAVFSPTPRTVCVDEENAKLIIDDKGLIAYPVRDDGEPDDMPAEAEIISMRTEIEHLRKANADLQTENASLREENRNLRAR